MTAKQIEEGNPSTIDKSSSNASDEKEKQNDEVSPLKVTYMEVLKNNPSFYLFTASATTNWLGEWLTYLASLTAIEKIQLEQQADATKLARTAIGLLVAVRLMTKAVMSFFGGVLADGFDRRKAMIYLDLIGAGVAFCFVLAVYLRSIPMIYGATFLQEVSSGLYDPSRWSIFPLLVPNKKEYDRAMILIGIVYSLVQAFGNAAGGFLLSILGTQGCFLVDSLTYLLSAYLMGMVRGNFQVSSENISLGTPWSTAMTMFLDGVNYVRSSFWGALLFYKFCLLMLTLDVVNISFAERGGENASALLGFLFSAVGFGLLVGPVIVERFTDANELRTNQVACIVSFGISSFSILLIGIVGVCPFWLVCVLTGFRAFGVAAGIVNASIIVQKFSAPEMYGRVCSLDGFLTLTGESLSAMSSGQLQDKWGFSPEQTCLSLGLLGCAMLVGWIIFHARGGGASIHGNTTDPCKSLLCPSIPVLPRRRKFDPSLSV